MLQRRVPHGFPQSIRVAQHTLGGRLAGWLAGSCCQMFGRVSICDDFALPASSTPCRIRSATGWGRRTTGRFITHDDCWCPPDSVHAPVFVARNSPDVLFFSLVPSPSTGIPTGRTGLFSIWCGSKMREGGAGVCRLCSPARQNCRIVRGEMPKLLVPHSGSGGEKKCHSAFRWFCSDFIMGRPGG